MTYQLHHGNCIDIMPLIERESVDAVICDPPYGLGFMGKDWDHGVPGMHFWLEALRCAKPGAYLLAFGGTRTFHRLAVAIEDAGWEIRDTVMWVYGQGFPKSHDVSKAIDREAGADREDIGVNPNKIGRTRDMRGGRFVGNDEADMEQICRITQPATPAAAEWDGWGTALKPAWEPIIVARKPLCGTVAENVQRYGTGAMKIDGCRIETASNDDYGRSPLRADGTLSVSASEGWDRPWRKDNDAEKKHAEKYRAKIEASIDKGRWPANLIHDGSAEVLAGFPMTTESTAHNRGRKMRGWVMPVDGSESVRGFSDTGSAARFFYCAKASKRDRDEGCEGLEVRDASIGDKRPSGSMSQRIHSDEGRPDTLARNHHPTVKPTALMRYLCRLVTPPQGVILDPFMGSGSTGKAAMLEGFNFIGIDTDIEYVEIAARRIEHACEKVGIVIEQPMMFETKRETVDRPKQLILL